ncbi:hypothetical protein LTR15_003194 [Elasticomyces elasticus]|nr:hypothetical protein LTR15_003194 [Elasticomyces elasticus]
MTHQIKEQDEVFDHQDMTGEEKNAAFTKEEEEAVANLEREIAESPLLKLGGNLGIGGSSIKNGLRTRETAFGTIFAMAEDMHTLARSALAYSDVEVVKTMPAAEGLERMRTSIKEQQAEVADMPEPQKTMMGEALRRLEALLADTLDDGSPEKLMAGDAELCAEMRKLLGPIERLLVTCKEIKCDRDLLLVQDWLVAASTNDDTPDDPADDEA